MTTKKPASTGEKQDTRFKPGQSGNPAGRKHGSRNRLGESFVEALAADFEVHGKAAIEKVRDENPSAYLRLIAGLLPAQVEIAPQGAFADLTEDELDAFIAETSAKLGTMQ